MSTNDSRTTADKIIKLEVSQRVAKERMAEMRASAEKSNNKINETHALVTSIDKSLAVFCQRAISASEDIEEIKVRVGGVEDTVSSHGQHIDKLMEAFHKKARQNRERETDELQNRRKQDERKWSILSLIPVTVITAVITGAVTLIFQGITTTEDPQSKHMRMEREAIKQTQIDKLKRELEDLKKRKKDG